MRRAARWAEALLVLVLFVASASWGASYWTASWKSGRQPEFYQENFEPAVMVACHRGFVVSHPQPKVLEDFLQRRTDAFSCDRLEGTTLGTQYVFQGAWRYLIVTVGLAWRWLGISWSGMAPLFGVFFGLTLVIAYGIFRLAMQPWLAAIATAALGISATHLVSLPHLRDYSKAPLTLALLLLLGLLVKGPVRRWRVIGLGAAYGVVVGIGCGFRLDFLVDIIPILVVLCVFLEGGPFRHLATKGAAAAAFAAAFLVAAWPILNVVSTKGGGQWHVALLGLTSAFSERLGIVPAPYDWGYLYDDGYVGKTTLAYAARVHPDWKVELLTPTYDTATAAYLREIVWRFPGDMMTRALASSVRLLSLPTDYPDAPLPGFAPALFHARSAVLHAVRGAGPWIAAAALVGAAAFDLRVGFFLLFVLLYFGGYPAVQFAPRHYFHFELITWWALGALLQGLIHGLVRRRIGGVSARRAAVFAAVAAAVVLVPLVTLRAYQTRQVRFLFQDYAQGDRLPVALGHADEAGLYRVAGPTSIADVKLLEVDVDRWLCGDRATVTFRYDNASPYENYTRTIDLPPSTVPTPTRLFQPVYASAFLGLELAASKPECLPRAFWVDPAHRPLLLTAMLAPGWEQQTLYQRWRYQEAAK